MKHFDIVVKALIVCKQEFLIVQRAEDPHRAFQWTLPGGHVEYGEDLKDAIRREVKEETNLDVTVIDVNTVWDFLATDAHVIASAGKNAQKGYCAFESCNEAKAALSDFLEKGLLHPDSQPFLDYLK